VEVERILAREQGNGSVKEPRKSNDSKRYNLAKLLDLGVIYTPRVYLQSSVRADDGSVHKALLSRQGILAVESSPLPRGVIVYSKFKYLDVKYHHDDTFRDRVSSIQFLLHLIVENKDILLTKKLMRALNRLSMVGLITNKSNFKSLLSYVHRIISASVSSQTDRRPKCRDYPVLSKQRKSLVFNDKHYTGPSWHWRSPRKVVRTPWI